MIMIITPRPCNVLGNRIQRVHGLQYGHLTNLVTLELRGNCLETTNGLYLPSLRRLYLVTVTPIYPHKPITSESGREQDPLTSVRFSGRPPGPECDQASGGLGGTAESHHPPPPRQPAGEPGRHQPPHDVPAVPQRQVVVHVSRPIGQGSQQH